LCASRCRRTASSMPVAWLRQPGGHRRGQGSGALEVPGSGTRIEASSVSRGAIDDVPAGAGAGGSGASLRRHCLPDRVEIGQGPVQMFKVICDKSGVRTATRCRKRH
jgi:hypothetical protein